MNPQPLRILLIEDNPGDARLVRESLRQSKGERAELVHADSLAKGLQQLGGSRFDVLLLDLQLPDSLGLEALEAVHKADQSVPVVVLTGTLDDTHGVEALRQGAQDYLTKSCSGGPQILRSIRHAIERKNAERELLAVQAQLERRVAERTAELRGALDSLQEELDQRLRMERQILELAECERQRIGGDLHDTLGAHLTGISFLLKAHQQKLQSQDNDQADEVGRILQQVKQAANMTRSIAQGLRPVEFGSGGLMQALQRHVESCGEIYGVNCTLDAPVPVEVADPTAATQLYYIAQEAITNAVKHGKARSICVGLKHEGGQLVLTVSDDGVGMKQGGPPGKGLGLEIMRYRARAAGGSLEVTAGASGGVVISCRVTVPAGICDAKAA
jgi:signal transduction histidine kinase